jgi:putative transposase
MIDRSHALPVVRQAELAGLSRASVYYLPKATPDADQRQMKRIDAIHLEYPFAGARMLRDLLAREGFHVGRRHIGTLMAKMGIEALYRKPNTSRKHPKNKVHPYLLRGLKIERANHVWATDITYIPMAQGWVYLCAIVDWASRRVLAHRISITMETDFCLEALHEAFVKHGQPEIFNTD